MIERVSVSTDTLFASESCKMHVFTLNNWFAERVPDLSLVDILPLAYICFVDHAVEHKERLLQNRIEAWQAGPVVIDLYQAYPLSNRKIHALEYGPKETMFRKEDATLHKVLEWYFLEGHKKRLMRYVSLEKTFQMCLRTRGAFTPISHNDVLIARNGEEF